MVTAPRRGADAICVCGYANAEINCGMLMNRISPFVDKQYEFCALAASGVAGSQSERGLDSAEWSPEGDPEARASGKSGAARSDRRETSGGGGAGLAVGWCEIVEQLHAWEGSRHE